MPRKIISVCILRVLGLWLLANWLHPASVATAADAAIAPRFSSREAFRDFVGAGKDSPFGLDYVFVHSPGARDQELIDEFCANVGIRWVNLTRLEWKRIERRAPNDGQHTYDWREMDLAVRAWHRNGIHIMVSLRFESPWATAPRTDKDFVYLRGLPKLVALRGADYLPKPEHMQDLQAYMAALVERYDGDGRDDMPGLLFPVLHYQIGNEYSNEVFWAGDVDEYGQLLRAAARGARSACPDVKIILSGIGFQDVFGFYELAMSPRTEAFVRQNLPRVPTNMRPFVQRTQAFSFASARFTDAYDILDARWPNFGTVTKSRELLRRVGIPDKPVWSAEIYSGFPLMEPLVLPNWTLHAWPTPSRSVEYLKILKNKNHAQFEELNAWYRGLQAAQIVKICMVALDAGSQKLMMGWAVDVQNPLAISTLSHHGLYSTTFKRLWPAGHTYGLVIRKLEGLQQVERVRSAENAYIYRCTVRDDRQILIAFCDDHFGQNHDQPTATLTAAIRVPWKQISVTQIIRDIGETEPKVEQARVSGGRLKTELTEYPMFIEAL